MTSKKKDIRLYTIIPLSVIVAILSFFMPYKEAEIMEWYREKSIDHDMKITMNLDDLGDEFNGFGCSSCWWSQVAGNGENAEEIAKLLYSEEGLKKLSEGCEKVCQDYVVAVRDAALAMKKAFVAAAIDPSDTSSHFMDKAIEKYKALKDKDFVPPLTDSFRKNADNPEKWFPKKNWHLKDSVTPALVAAVNGFTSLFDKDYKVYNTALLLQAQV